jgi:Condensin II complex subunit CAP-H2 or CNDH2, C-term/Condensin II complex subunit CAP-H2 or CNDH2, N-terminal
LEKLVDVLHGNAGPSIFAGADDRSHPAGGGDLAGGGGGGSWDFAQAALLVQNSSAVYGRKVDYFSSLVVKALEGFQHSIDEAGLSNSRGGGGGNNARGGAANRNGGGNATDEDRAFWGLLRDDNYDFLTLDDVMPVAKPSDITRGTAAKRRKQQQNDRRASLGTLSLSRYSMSFHTQRQSTLQSLSQQLSGANQASSSHLASSVLDHLDAAGPSGALEDAPYRVPKYHSLNLVGSKCEVTPTGALLLPGVAEASGVLGRRHPRRGRRSVPVVVQASIDREDADGTPSHKSLSPDEPAGAADDVDFPVASDDPYDDDDDDDRDNSGPGFDFGGHDDDDHENQALAPQQQQHSRAGVLRTAQDGSRMPKKSVTFNDPWELLDPHQPVGNPRPLKKGMTLVVPDGLADLPSDCVTGARTKSRTGKEARRNVGRASQSLAAALRRSTNGPLSESYATDMYRHLTDGTDLPEMSLTDLAFGEEFAYIRKLNRRIQMAEKRKARQSAHSGAADVDAWDVGHDPVQDDRDADFGAFDDGNDDDYEDYERDDSGGGGGGIVWGDDEGPNTGNAGLASVEDAFHGDDGTIRECVRRRCNAAPLTLVRLLSFLLLPDDGGLTFEELCRARIQEFAKGAEKYANETQLLQRVRRWQEKLQPLLEEEEERQVFDIHEYGRAIIDSIQTELATRKDDDEVDDDNSVDVDSTTVPFEAVARDRPKYDVPRLFLAALSLCNAGNVCIDEDLNLQLLSPVMEHPMETFLAPSVREKQ